VLIAIIAILAGLILPALSSAAQQAKRTRAKTEMKLLETAIAMWESDYGVLPLTGGVDKVLSDRTEYKQLICYLQNRDPVNPEDPALSGNPRKKRYLDISTEQGPGVFNDPWSTESKEQRYQIALDLDYNGVIDKWCGGTEPTSIGENDGPYETVYGRVAIWSFGKDKKPAAGGEGDINSWRQ